MTEKSRDMLVALAVLIGLGLLLSFLSPVQLVRQGADTLRTAVAAFRERRAEQPETTPAGVSAPLVDGAVSSGQNVSSLPTGQREAMPAPGMARWITSDDYPAEALRNNWQGRVAISWTIDEAGRATDCVVLESSGHAVLDDASCRLVLNRARYVPALDGEGRPIQSRDYRRIVWQLPD